MDKQEIFSMIVRSNPITDQLITRFRLWRETLYNHRLFVKNFGRLGMNKSEVKFSSDLRIRVHAIEKGLSLPNPRVGFGEEKVKKILEMVRFYKQHFNNQQFLVEVKSILESYFSFQQSHGYKNKDLYSEYSMIFNQIPYVDKLGGLECVSKKKIEQESLLGFESFVKSRYAVRDFSPEPIDIALIRNALKIAEKTPSACNRQPWRVYVFNGEKKNELLKWQHGSLGFFEEIDTAVLVCCDTQSYFMGEANLPYVDGGLYAMTLIYALHSQGLGTIPLTMGLMSSQLKQLYTKFGVKKSEVPILLIGVGNLKEEFKVALSHRYTFDTYTKFM